MSVNKVTLIGRLGQDPKNPSKEKSVAKFSIATSDGWGDNKYTSWHNCVAFRKTAEVIMEYVKKGDMLYIEGSIKYGEYEKDGVKHKTMDIMIDKIKMLSLKNGDKKESAPEQYVKDKNVEEFDTEIPF